jgi:hypothetical protein
MKVYTGSPPVQKPLAEQAPKCLIPRGRFCQCGAVHKRMYSEPSDRQFALFVVSKVTATLPAGLFKRAINTGCIEVQALKF